MRRKCLTQADSLEGRQAWAGRGRLLCPQDCPGRELGHRRTIPCPCHPLKLECQFIYKPSLMPLPRTRPSLLLPYSTWGHGVGRNLQAEEGSVRTPCHALTVPAGCHEGRAFQHPEWRDTARLPSVTVRAGGFPQLVLGPLGCVCGHAQRPELQNRWTCCPVVPAVAAVRGRLPYCPPYCACHCQEEGDCKLWSG